MSTGSLGGEYRSDGVVLAVSPYISDKVIFANGRTLRGGVLTAIDPALEAGSPNTAGDDQGSLGSAGRARFSVVLGASMARILRVRVGDKLEVTVPRLTVTPLGVFPAVSGLP